METLIKTKQQAFAAGNMNGDKGEGGSVGDKIAANSVVAEAAGNDGRVFPKKNKVVPAKAPQSEHTHEANAEAQGHTSAQPLQEADEDVGGQLLGRPTPTEV